MNIFYESAFSGSYCDRNGDCLAGETDKTPVFCRKTDKKQGFSMGRTENPAFFITRAFFAVCGVLVGFHRHVGILFCNRIGGEVTHSDDCNCQKTENVFHIILVK